MQLPPNGFGLNTWTQNVVANNNSMTNLYSLYNNGFTRTSMKVQTFSPYPQSNVNFQGREFSNYAFIPVMQHLGQSGLLNLPAAYQYIRPAGGHPTMSQLTNWGGNPTMDQPMMAPQQAPMMMPQQAPMMMAPQAMFAPQQAPMMMPQANLQQPMAMQAPMSFAQPAILVAPPIFWNPS
jgi:hypothetical protein